MFKFDSLKRKIKAAIARKWRGISYGIGFMKTKKKFSDMLLIKTVKSLIDSPNCRVIFSPLSSKIYAHHKDKNIIVIFDGYSVNITNHKYFFTTTLKDGLAEEIMKAAKERIERDVTELESVITVNEKDFLKNVYSSFTMKEQ
jgi:hypothetical protein